MARSNLAFFAQEMLSGPPEAPFLNRFLIGAHHEEWADLINDHPQLCVLAPRGHGKSQFFTVAYVIWEAFRNPGQEALILSGSEEQAIDQLSKIKDEVETNPALSFLRPKKANTWAKKDIEFGNGFRVRARGFMTKVRGAHPHFIVLDDVVNEESAFSDQMRSKVEHFFFSAIFNMKHTANVKFRIVGTPQHQQDLYGILSEREGFHFQRFQAITNGKALWPEVLPLPELLKIKRTVGELVFARERQCEVVNDDASVFPLSLFLQPGVLRPELKLGLPGQYWDQAGVYMRYMGIDFAISTSQGADFTVIFVMGVDPQGTRWVIDIIRDKGLGFQEQLSMIRDAQAKYQCQMIYCESNQMQSIFGDELVRTTDLPIRKVITGSEKHSLERGLPSLRVLHEQQKYRVPRGDARSLELTDEWMKEMQSFTFKRGRIKSTGRHDDIGMANYICERAVKESDFSFCFGEQPGDAEALEEMMYDIDEESEDYIRAEPASRYGGWGDRSLLEAPSPELPSSGDLHPADAAILRSLIPR